MGALQVAAQSFRAGQVSAQEAVSLSLKQIETAGAQLRAFLGVNAEAAMERAQRIDEARAAGAPLGPLAGVPIAIKDNISTSFGRTTCGSRILEDFHAQYDACVVERLSAAGAVVVAKTNLDEFAMGSSTENSAFMVTRNPWNESRVSGGSSGGSAAAVAARIVPAALGSDTGGSIRQPASFCGVVGLKPSYGRVSRFGLVAYGSSLDQIGPITTDVLDAVLLFSAIAGHDSRDATCSDAPLPDLLKALDTRLDGLRIGVSAEYFGEGLDPEVRAAVEAAVELYRSEGASIIPIQLPHMRYAIACYYIVACAEASSNLARFDGVRFGRRTPHPRDTLELYAASRGEGFGSEAARRIMLGTYVLSSGYYDAYYLKALKVRTLIKRDFDRAFESVDVIASPAVPTTAFAIGEKSNDPLAMYLSDVYSVSANLAGIPAISIPCGFDAGNLPIGLQLMAAPFAEATLLAAAHQYQLRTDYHTRQPPGVPTP